MRITIIGTGYVGLVTGAAFSITGNKVTCIDIDQEKINLLNRGEMPIHETGLHKTVSKGVKDKSLRFTTDVAEGMSEADLVFLSVGTPEDDDSGADLSQLFAAAKMIAPQLCEETIVVIKSTVPVGTNARLSKYLNDLCEHPVEVVSNPEFLKEGSALDDCLNPDRIVVGVRCSKTANLLSTLYAPYVNVRKPFVVMSPESAEMTKYVANCMLATKISFINEMANLCDRLGAHIDDVCIGIGYDRRIGFDFLRPGLGYGGSCFPKDIRALTAQARSKGYEPTMLAATDGANERQKTILIEKIDKYFGHDLRGKRIAIWGLAFKPNTDDIREAPSLALIDWLLDRGATVCVHDPVAMPKVRALYGERIEYAQEHWDAVRKADALAIVTEWSQYRRMNPGTLRWHLSSTAIFDGRNCLDLEDVRTGNFTYFGVGRGDPPAVQQFNDTMPICPPIVSVDKPNDPLGTFLSAG